MIAYRVVDWQKNFENNRTKEVLFMKWVPMPTKHDGDGYTELLVHPDGAAHFGTWCALVQVAAKCDPRGTFLRDDRGGVRRPHDPASLSRIIRIPEALIAAALVRLQEIGWVDAIHLETGELVNLAPSCVEVAPSCDAGAALSRERGRDKTGDNRTGQDNTSSAASAAARAPKLDRNPQTMKLPSRLDTTDFRLTIGDWLEYRKDKKNGGPWTDKTLTLNLAQWDEWGPERAIAAMLHTMRKGWRGIVEPDGPRFGGNVSQLRPAGVDPRTIEKAKGTAHKWPMDEAS